MAFSAAELQKRHGLEGAPDPFPTLGNNTPAPKSTSAATKVNGAGSGSSSAPAPADHSSEDAFPSLGPSAGAATNIAKPAISAWSSKPSAVKTSKGKVAAAGGLGRTGAPTATSHPFSDTFSVPSRDIETGKAYQDILKKVQESTGASVESSTQMSSGLRTFLIRAADQKRLAYARKLLERGLSKSVTIQVEVPISTLGTIIGPKGATLKSITDSTQCKIDIPRRDTLPAWDPKEVDEDDEDAPEEPVVPISVSGPSVACNDARTKILGLISLKVSQTTQSIKTIPSSYYPFIAGVKGVKARQLEEEIGQGEVKVHIPPPAVWKALERQGEEEITEKDLSIKVRGEKEKVKAVVEHILQEFEKLNDSFRELKISIPKRQHRFLVGSAADQILEETGCIVELPPVEDPSDQCAIRGPQPGLVPALTMAMDKANAIAVEMVDVVALHRTNTSDSLSHAKRILRFLTRNSRLRSIAETHGVKVYPPFASTVSATGNVVIEVVGEDRAKVSKAKEEVAQVVKSILPAGVAVVEIDSLVHSILIGKKGGKIAQFESANNVTTVFPPVAEDSSEVLIVYIGEGLPSDKKARDVQLSQALSAASAALESLAKEASNIKTETLDIDKKWHKYIIGQGGTVLNALIGEDQLVNVRVGSKDKSKSGGDDDNTVVVRGPPSEVDRVVIQINSIVEDAKNDDIVNGYTLEFTVDRKHVPHLVGSSGAAINKLRETLGVKINFDDDDKKGGKRAPCKIVGRKEAVEEAKKRLEAQVEKLEDETTESVNIKRAIQPALIGSGGKYAIRLEEKYGVKLSFPRDNKDGSATTKPDEVTIRGGKKGVAAAKAELLEAAAFENESRQELKFSVPSKSVAQIVGKSGSTINGIKDETGAQIDIDKTHGDDGKTSITVRGSKDAIAAAKKAVLAVVEEVGDEINVSLTIDPKYHRTLIGQGGNNLRDIVVNAGGPSESFKQAGLITFPREGRDTAPDEVRLRGDSKLVNKIKAELEKQVDILKQTIIVGVVVPQAQHASKIGRGGSALQDLQRKTGATIHFPGSRQYGSIGQIENASDLEGTEASDIVKVIGTKEVVAKATELLQVSSERPQQQNRGGRDTPDWTTRSISIPTKYYHAVADYPNLMRSVRNVGGQVQLPQPAPPKPTATRPTSGGGLSLAAQAARIDLDGNDEQGAEEITGNWEVIQNYQDGDDSELEWTVRGKEENLDKLVSILETAVEKAKSATHVGLLTGLPRSTFPRIIGSKGATISRLRVETGADIQVGKDDDLITIIGDEASVNQGKDAILSIVNRSGGARY